MTPIRVRLYAAARAAAGTATTDLPAGTLAELIQRLTENFPALASVLPRCSYLIDGSAAHGDPAETALTAGCEVDVLPPFAGG